MKLTTARLSLEEITWDDLQIVHELHSIPELDEYNTLGIPENIERTKEVMKPAIEDQDNDPRTGKIGMTREGLRRKILPIRGEWKDNYHYAIVEDDPEAPSRLSPKGKR